MNHLRKIAFGGAMAGTALLGGALGASLIGTANAQTSFGLDVHDDGRLDDWHRDPATRRATGTRLEQGRPPGQRHHRDGADRRRPHQGQAAAEAAVPGATAERAETDAEGAAYEVHMTKADGSVVTVKLDSNFNVTETIDGMG